MKKSRCTEARILRLLQEVDAGKPVAVTAREHGVSRETIYRWKTRYGRMTLTELKRLRILEDENNRLKRIVAQQAIDIELFKEISSKNW